MYKAKIITGLALTALAFFLILGLSGTLFVLLVTLMSGFALREWSKISGISEIQQFIYLLLAAFSLFVSFPLWQILTKLSIVFWVISPFIIIQPLKKTAFLTMRPIMVLLGFILLVPFWLALVMLHDFDQWLLLHTVILVVVADSSAFFIGHHFGKHKMLPHISPNKTWEGALGALVSSLLIGLLLPRVFSSITLHALLPNTLFTLFVVTFAIIGDFFESMIKRHLDLKDTGVLLPGHGGIFDRIDSLVAALPMVLGLYTFWPTLFHA